MATRLNPYISFRGNARAAMEFYRSVLGGDLTVSTFADYQMSVDPAEADNIMHAQLVTPAGFTLMGSDTPASMPFEEGGTITISLSGDVEPELRGYWDGLAVDGAIGLPLEQAPWGDYFGMLTDKFGIGWMVNIAGPGHSATDQS